MIRDLLSYSVFGIPLAVRIKYVSKKRARRVASPAAVTGVLCAVLHVHVGVIRAMCEVPV